MSSRVISSPNASSHNRAVIASRFMRPPGKFKRAQIREKPRVLIGPFENPIRRFVRMREKAKHFSLVPPPRRIPIPSTIVKKFLQPLSDVPTVSSEALNHRLDFLLSSKASLQQIHSKMRPGATPFQIELFMWERQVYIYICI